MFNKLKTWLKNLFNKPAAPAAPKLPEPSVADSIKKSVTERVTTPEGTVKPKRPNRRKKNSAAKQRPVK